MYTGLLHLHSTLRYVALVLLVVTLAKALITYFAKRNYTETDRKFGLYTLISVHLQLVVGLILYFVSPMISGGLDDMGEAMKNPALRFYVVEHFVTMLLGITMITIGYSRIKRSTDNSKKALKTLIFYGIGFLLILIRMPWDRW